MKCQTGKARGIMAMLLLFVSMICVCLLAVYVYSTLGEKRAVEELKTAVLTEVADGGMGEIRAEQQEATRAAGEGAAKTRVENEVIAALVEQNEDTFGWITLPGTPIDYPVMFTPHDAEYYIDHDFNKNSSKSGLPFLDAEYIEGSDNMLIYAHNMKAGTMFHKLLAYEDEAFYNEHKTIELDTLYETKTYEIAAVFRSRVYTGQDDCFKYYTYGCIDDEQSFAEYVRGAKELSLYETGVKMEYGDELITLSTCSYHEKNGRFAVVGRLVRG